MYRYTSHCNSEYKIDSCFTNDDAFVMSGSENGKIYFWDLVEVHTHTHAYLKLNLSLV